MAILVQSITVEVNGLRVLRVLTLINPLSLLLDDQHADELSGLFILWSFIDLDLEPH